MNYYLAVLKKYFVFSGRAQRAEYWYFVLFNIIVSAILNYVDSVLKDGAIISSLYGLAVLIPSLAVGIRRLHDVGKSAWMLLIALIPIIGWIWLLVLMCIDSNVGDNKYGPNPKAVKTV